MKKILVPTDFSDNADLALTLAKQLAFSSRATIEIVHVFRPPVPDAHFPADQLLSMMDEAEMLAIDGLQRLRCELEAEGIGVRTSLRYGAACDGIMEAIAQGKPDLVVLGRTGNGKTIDRLLGSVASRIAMQSPCPVLVVPMQFEVPRIRSIVYATQLEFVETDVLRFVFSLAKQCGATVTLVKVNDEEQLDLYDDTRFVKEIESTFPNEIVILEQVEASSVQNGLSNYMKTHASDLLVLANQKRNWLAGLLNPSLSKAMVLQTNTPLLVCHLNDD